MLIQHSSAYIIISYVAIIIISIPSKSPHSPLHTVSYFIIIQAGMP